MIQNRLKNIKKAKTKVRRLIHQYGFDFIYTFKFANNSIGIRDGDSKIRELRRKLKRSFSSFEDYILTRPYDENGLLYYKLLTNVSIYPSILILWKHGSVSIKTYDNRIDLHSFFTESFKDKRFEGYCLYSTAKSTTLKYDEAYFDSVSDIKSYMASRYPNLKKCYEKNYPVSNANVTSLFFKKG